MEQHLFVHDIDKWTKNHRSHEVATISIDYEDYARADETARNEGSTLYGDIMSLIRGKIGERNVLHTPDEVRAHFVRLMDETASPVPLPRMVE